MQLICPIRSSVLESGKENAANNSYPRSVFKNSSALNYKNLIIFASKKVCAFSESYHLIKNTGLTMRITITISLKLIRATIQ